MYSVRSGDAMETRRPNCKWTNGRTLNIPIGHHIRGEKNLLLLKIIGRMHLFHRFRIDTNGCLQNTGPEAMRNDLPFKEYVHSNSLADINAIVHGLIGIVRANLESFLSSTVNRAGTVSWVVKICSEIHYGCFLDPIRD